MMIKYLITGANGQVGSQLVRQLSDKAEVFATDRQTLDITDFAAVQRITEMFRPDVIINAAAYTAVDRAESETELAYQVNAVGAEHLARAAERVQAVILHLSTDYVFDGKQDIPYREEDAVAPQNVYGRTKWAGEQAVIAHCSRSIIMRTAWVFNEQGRNFVKTMLRLAQQRDELRVVADQFGAPTYAGDIAAALIVMAEQLVHQQSRQYGIYHFSGSPSVSWYDFAATIFAQAVAQGVLTQTPVLHRISTEDYPTPARRPVYSHLNGGKIQAAFGLAPSDWQRALAQLHRYLD